jgi:hypothetical protein
MSEPKTSTEEILVRLVLAGVSAVEYHLAEGATLADLLRISAASTTNQAVLVDGETPEEALPLRDGAVVMIVPRPRNSAVDEPWRAAVPSVRDQALFQEYSEVLEDRRREIDPEEDPQAGSSWTPTPSVTYRRKIPSES